MLAVPTSTPRFKRIIFIQIDLKLSYFCKKTQNFRALGAPPPDPRNSPPPLRNPGYAPTHHYLTIINTEEQIGCLTFLAFSKI